MSHCLLKLSQIIKKNTLDTCHQILAGTGQLFLEALAEQELAHFAEHSQYK